MEGLSRPATESFSEKVDFIRVCRLMGRVNTLSTFIKNEANRRLKFERATSEVSREPGCQHILG
jgi:hypothetical protein